MSNPSRQLLPKPSGYIHPVFNSPDKQPTRQRAPAACQPCRTRKSKCDTQRPVCGACTLRGTECEYDIAPNTTRYTSLKRRHQNLEEEHVELLQLYDMLRFRPESDAIAILNRIRAGTDLQSILAFVKEGDLLVQARTNTTDTYASVLPPARSRYEAQLNVHHPNAYPALPPLDDPAADLGDKRKSILDLPPQDHPHATKEEIENARFIHKPRAHSDERLCRVQARRWTRVACEDATLANLIALYLSWEHSTFRIFDEDYFLDQLVEGSTDYCSSLLVNAICAAATLNYRAIDPEAEALGKEFYEEAKRLWRAEEGQSRLLHIPAAILLGSWYYATCKDTIALALLLQGVQIAKDLGLFRRANHTPASTPGPFHRGRAVIAWGIFNWQALHAYLVQTDTHLVRPPSFPIPNHEEDEADWNPFPLLHPKETNYRGLTLKTLSELCIIVNEYMIVRDRVTSLEKKDSAFENAKLLHFKMLQWADGLPPEHLRRPRCLPLVVDLHLFYHAFIVQAFRPFAGDNDESGRMARELTDASLCQLQRLLYIQQHRYGGPPLVSGISSPIHILFFSLLDSMSKSDAPDPEVEFYLLLCANAMKQIGECFPSIRLVLHSLLATAKQRIAKLPEAIEAVFLEVDAQLFSRITIEEIHSRYPIDLEVALTDPEKVTTEVLIKAAYAQKQGNSDT